MLHLSADCQGLTLQTLLAQSQFQLSTYCISAIYYPSFKEYSHQEEVGVSNLFIVVSCRCVGANDRTRNNLSRYATGGKVDFNDFQQVMTEKYTAYSRRRFDSSLQKYTQLPVVTDWVVTMTWTRCCSIVCFNMIQPLTPPSPRIGQGRSQPCLALPRS